jgi:hydroxypyruvate isomerase
MLRYDVNLSILFTEFPLTARPAAARAAGFDAVELWWPFADPVPGDREVDGLLRTLDDAGVRLVGLNFFAGDMAAGDRGVVSHVHEIERFRANVDVVVDIAQRTGCRVLNALYGNRFPGVSGDAAEDVAAGNLAYAAAAARRAGATVVVEALNAFENPEYPVTSSAHAFRLIDRVRNEGGVENVAFLADLYHLHRMGEDLPALVERDAIRFGHVQIADAPGRGEPGTGEVDFPSLLYALPGAGYAGFIGLEYRPTVPSAESFGWLSAQPQATGRAQ